LPIACLDFSTIAISYKRLTQHPYYKGERESIMTTITNTVPEGFFSVTLTSGSLEVYPNYCKQLTIDDVLFLGIIDVDEYDAITDARAFNELAFEYPDHVRVFPDGSRVLFSDSKSRSVDDEDTLILQAETHVSRIVPVIQSL
jgi:hypothetical protein